MKRPRVPTGLNQVQRAVDRCSSATSPPTAPDSGNLGDVPVDPVSRSYRLASITSTTLSRETLWYRSQIVSFKTKNIFGRILRCLDQSWDNPRQSRLFPDCFVVGESLVTAVVRRNIFRDNYWSCDSGNLLSDEHDLREGHDHLPLVSFFHHRTILLELIWFRS